MSLESFSTTDTLLYTLSPPTCGLTSRKCPAYYATARTKEQPFLRLIANLASQEQPSENLR